MPSNTRGPSRPCPRRWPWPTMGSPSIFDPTEEDRSGSRMAPDSALVDRLTRHGQGHLLTWWGELDENERARLVAEIEGIDFDQLDRLVATLVKQEAAATPAAERIGPIKVVRLPQTDGDRIARRHVVDIGAAALAAGEVAVVLV